MKKLFATVTTLLAGALLFATLVASASTITTIAGSDTLTASRSTINTNFSNLNTDKLESQGPLLYNPILGLIHATGTSNFNGNIQFGGSATSTFSTTGTSTMQYGLLVGNTAGAGGLRVTNGGIRVESLVSCDTINTDSGGSFVCGTDATSAGSAGGTWGTTTSSVAGQLLNYSNNTTDIILIGHLTATSGAKYFFDPNASRAYLVPNVGIGTTSAYAALSVVGEVVASHFTGTTTSASSFGGAVSITGALTAPTVDTGQGANELYDMDQNVLVASNVTFANIITSTFVDLITTGVRLSGADGVLTMLGLGNGNDENLTIDLDNGSANVVDIGSGTGVTTINWGTIGADFDSSSVALSTVTGAVDAGGATSVEIVNGSGPTIDAIGEIALDTTNNDLVIGTSTNSSYPSVIRTQDQIIARFKVGSTSQAYASSSMDIPTDIRGLTVTGVSCYVEGGTSVAIVLSDANGTNDTNSVTCANTRPTAITPFTVNNTWTAGERMGVEWGTKTGTVDYVNVTLYGNSTRT